MSKHYPIIKWDWPRVIDLSCLEGMKVKAGDLISSPSCGPTDPPRPLPKNWKNNGHL